MKIISFKTNKPRGFNFRPRYYNADKEEFEARKMRSIREYQLEQKTGYKPDELRAKLQTEWSRKHDADKVARQSTLRISVIALVLFGAAYLYLFTDFLG